MLFPKIYCKQKEKYKWYKYHRTRIIELNFRMSFQPNNRVFVCILNNPRYAGTNRSATYPAHKLLTIAINAAAYTP